ncbi:MAG TPA: recombinase family protein [Candidatus Cybelea sp.]|jgi:DNA invertase Pin-like site-specific DNA recombinase
MPSKATTTSTTKVVSYIRVSTQRQGQSGLGLEAQQAAIAQYCQANGYELLQEFREIESGRNNERPILRKAIAKTKAARALLVIAKLDRLARSVHFVSGLMEQVDFRACDYPDKDPFMLHVRAAFSEEECRRISQRTREALAAAKARGTLLGAANPRCRSLTQENRLKGATASGKRTAAAAREANYEATSIARELHREGMALRAIAAELELRGVSTRTGAHWSHVQVLRLLRRAA